jgi:hypothetical protein
MVVAIVFPSLFIIVVFGFEEVVDLSPNIFPRERLAPFKPFLRFCKDRSFCHLIAAHPHNSPVYIMTQ